MNYNYDEEHLNFNNNIINNKENNNNILFNIQKIKNELNIINNFDEFLKKKIILLNLLDQIESSFYKSNQNNLTNNEIKNINNNIIKNNNNNNKNNLDSYINQANEIISNYKLNYKFYL